jgi:glycerophosphoryl diester phosphodiesterase
MVHPFLSYGSPIGVAHRGGADRYPENTQSAFRNAYQHGFRYLETDLHATADGVIIAFHDDRLDRVTNRTGRVRDLTWAQIREASVAGTEPILTLTELFDLFPDALLNLDPKDDAVVDGLVEMIAAHGVHDRVCVSSFSRRRAARIKQLVEQTGPRLCTGAGPLAIATVLLRLPFRSALRGIDVLQVPARWGPIRVATSGFVRRAHRLGMHVHVWTIDDPEEIRELLRCGVDGVMSDDLLALRGVFDELGWSIDGRKSG